MGRLRLVLQSTMPDGSDVFRVVKGHAGYHYVFMNMFLRHVDRLMSQATLEGGTHGGDVLQRSVLFIVRSQTSWGILYMRRYGGYDVVELGGSLVQLIFFR